ncbi:c-type cytochrome [Lihuaxuella thermophila]|uniref:Cytochrome c551 n=1 Tax=Lihuaxuella thermophila TaxID=1173111 RepID=A0A1H8GDI4_9BACL|nr:cytochrome c [Lihuaxuella thermophila]SEN42231.1 cytochrome c551 [Lihuaxuella thermophila]
MKRIRSFSVLFMILTAVVFLTACGAAKKNDTGQQTAQISEPQEIYSQHCANCHGGNLQGSFGPGLQKVGTKYSKEQILEIIQKGKGSMPSQDYVPKEDQVKLAEWLSKQK